MVQARLLDEHVAKLQRKTKARRLASTLGEEACRVATAIELKQGDFVSDALMSATMDLLFGAPLAPLLRNIAAVVSGSQTRDRISTNANIVSRQLSWIADAEHRLNMAMGAALALKAQKQNNIVMAYAYQAELPKRVWKHALSLAAQLDLPIIFVLLPTADGIGEATSICKDARMAGLPRIPVDANDAVALYRVAQESMGRSRGGDGPVLIECISFRTTGQRKDKTSDPILHMKNFLTGRNVCTQDWANHVCDPFRKKLIAVNL